MAPAALIFAFISFVKFIYSLAKLLCLKTDAKKCNGKISKRISTENCYKGNKNDKLFTFEVIIDEMPETSEVIFEEVVSGKHCSKIRIGDTYEFYVKDDKAYLVKTATREPIRWLISCVGCIALVVVIALLGNALGM